MTAPEVILFDWDSTLVDNWDAVVMAWNDAARLIDCPAISREEAITRAGIPPDDNFMELFGDRWQEGKSRFYEVLRHPSSIQALKTLPGSVEMLAEIRGMGIPMAVISNKKSIILNAEIEHLGWTGYFFAVVGSGDAAFDKPRPDPLLYALRLGEMMPGEHIWMVGDMHSDIEAACLAGVTPILIETTSSLGLGLEGNFDTHKPRSRVSDAQAFLELVKQERDTISIEG